MACGDEKESRRESGKKVEPKSRATAAALSWGRAAKDGRAGAVEMSQKNVCLIDGNGLSILVAIFARAPCGMRPIVAVEPAKKTFLRGFGAKKVVSDVI